MIDPFILILVCCGLLGKFELDEEVSMLVVDVDPSIQHIPCLVIVSGLDHFVFSQL
jgi:hypothetical protein